MAAALQRSWINASYRFARSRSPVVERSHRPSPTLVNVWIPSGASSVSACSRTTLSASPSEVAAHNRRMRRRSDPNVSRIAVEVSVREAERSAGTASPNGVPQALSRYLLPQASPASDAFCLHRRHGITADQTHSWLLLPRTMRPD